MKSGFLKRTYELPLYSKDLWLKDYAGRSKCLLPLPVLVHNDLFSMRFVKKKKKQFPLTCWGLITNIIDNEIVGAR